jgi:2-polyprenyl-3-methyl-5-hydroxy-6-metoxy-1,4-benzoquinol methylase
MASKLKTRYPVKKWKYSSHAQILKLVGEGHGKKLLDVGCASGELLKEVTELGWDAIGIEPDFDDFLKASSSGAKVINSSLDEAIESIDEKYSVIILADVIEHMTEPANAVFKLKSLLAKNGRIIISVPNVAHFFIRGQLFFGKFNYTERGILDKTHLRFFTKKTILALIKDLDLEILSFRITPTPIEIYFRKSKITLLKNIFLTLIYTFSQLRQEIFGYQFILEVKVYE